MMWKLIGLLSVFAVCSVQCLKLPVTVYYESLCPDSQAFITKQLHPLMKTPLGKFIELKLVPFGKSNYSTLGADVLFTCHHGPDECYGNKVQSCAIDHIQVDSFQHEHTRETLSLEYINCLMSQGKTFPDSIYPGERCAKQVGLNNWDVIHNCANSTEGSKSLQKNGEETGKLQPPLTSVPTITFKHQFDGETNKLASINLQQVVCKNIPEPIPIECKGINGGINIQMSGLMVVIPVVAALHRMLF